MPETTNQKFKLVVPITGYTIRKDASGVEKYVVTGLASNTNMDLTGERMADSAIDAMVKSLETNKITLNNEHGSDWDDDFGEVTKLWANDNHELMMEAELDPDHYRTKTFIKALDKGKQLGLSIGGYVKEAAREWFEEAARMVMTYKDISLFHVAITGTPAVAETWVTPITKSVKDWKEMPMPKTQTTKNDEAVVETPVTETPAEDKDKVEETPVTEPEAVEPSSKEEAEVETPAEEPVVETPAEPIEVETPAEPAEVETPAQPQPADGEAPEAPETDTTEKSDATPDEKPEVVEETPLPEPTPAEPEAPEQKDEAPASAEAAPDPAEEGTSEVEKSTIFGGWATADITEAAVTSLSYELQWNIWVQMASTEKSAEERLTAIKAALAEYGEVAYKVAEALIQNTSDEDLSKAAEAFKQQSPDAVSKSLADRDTKVEELTKTVTEKDAKVGELQKSLEDKAAELDTKAKELTVAMTKIGMFEARKGIVFDKFTGAEAEKGQKTDDITAQSHRKFAEFIFNGAEGS